MASNTKPLEKEINMDTTATDMAEFHIISPVFRDGSPIPPQYSPIGQNVNPPLNIFDPPDGTQSMALYMHDPDATGGDFCHWLLWDITPSTEAISVNNVPIGAVQGANGYGQPSYAGPAPPAGSGTHRYIFELYALDKSLNLPSGADVDQMQKAMEGHILAHSQLTGTFTAAS